MSCNLVNNEAELRTAFEVVSNSQSGNEWTIFEYDANSNIVKLGATGNGGINELLENFHNGKVQYGFGTVAGNVPTGSSNAPAQRKVFLIHWQGEGVPASRLATTASHVEEIRRFVRRVNLTIYARNDEDLDRETLAKQFEKVQEIAPNVFGGTGKAADVPSQNSGASVSTPFVPPGPVGAIYNKPVPEQDLNRDEREKFWAEMRNEEEVRRREEADRRRQLQEQYGREQKQLAEQLHKAHLEKSETPKQLGKSQSFDAAAINAGGMKGKLIAGRTHLFEQKMAELAEAKPAKKPKNFKWQVNLQSKAAGEIPVNRVPEPPPKQFECVLKRKEQPQPQVEQPKLQQQMEQPKLQQQMAHQEMPQEIVVNKIPVAPVPPVARQQAAAAIIPPPMPQIPDGELKEEKAIPPPLAESPPPNEPTCENSKLGQQEQTEMGKMPEKLANGGNNGGGGGGIRVKALWDYQAEDATELTFDPEDIISDVQMVHDGWWFGRAPTGEMGLFPSNYVQLI